MTYVYFILATALLGSYLICLLVRPDLAKVSLRIGVMGGVGGWLAEIFYFRDYWRPPTIAGVAHLSPEDFLFGFAIAGLAAILYPVVAQKVWVRGSERPRMWIFSILMAGGLVGLLAFNIWAGVNSIIVSSLVFALCSVVMVYLRKDLLWPALYSAALTALLAIMIYLPLFDLWATSFWDKYWLLAHTSLGVTILGNIPLTEVLWYASWGLFGGIAYPFVAGKRFEPVR